MSRCITLVAVALLLSVATHPLYAAIVSITSSGTPTSIRVSTPTSTDNGPDVIVGRTNNDGSTGTDEWIRGVLNFDLSGIPDGAAINSAVLTLTVDNADASSSGGTIGGNIEAFNLTETYNTAASGVTYSERDNPGNVAWSTAGGTFNPTAVATFAPSVAQEPGNVAGGEVFAFTSAAGFTGAVGGGLASDNLQLLVRTPGIESDFDSRKIYFFSGPTDPSTATRPTLTVAYNIIAQYDLEVGANTAQDAADFVGANATAGNYQAIINGSLSTSTGGGGSGISSAGQAFVDRNITGATITPTTDDYHTFTVTPDPGFEFTFENITFDYLLLGDSGVTYSYELRSSIDGFTSILGTATSVGGPFNLAQDIDLSGLAPQSSPVEFRFFFSDNNDTAGRQHRIDNVILFGTVTAIPAPEPSTFVLLALGIIGLGVCGRRRRRLGHMALLVAMTFLFASQNTAHATLVIADYNDLSAGNEQTQAGGTGFSTAWAGTGTIDVISGDLAAPASTNYAITQSGTPLSVIGDWNDGRQNTRSLSTPLTGNTVWFSFLVQNTDATSRGGITFNGTSGTSLANPRIQTVGSGLFVNGSTTGGVFTTGQTALVLGRILVDDDFGDPDTFDIWVDPNVANGPNGLGTPTFSQTTNLIGVGGLTSLGNISYHFGGAGGGVQNGSIIDAIRVSDSEGFQGFTDVTGIVPAPEPSTALMAITACLGLVMLRRRKRA